jgi:hypothetical protein
MDADHAPVRVGFDVVDKPLDAVLQATLPALLVLPESIAQLRAPPLQRATPPTVPIAEQLRPPITCERERTNVSGGAPSRCRMIGAFSSASNGRATRRKPMPPRSSEAWGTAPSITYTRL